MRRQAGAAVALALASLPATAQDRTPPPADTLRDVVRAVRACWKPPRGLAGVERVEQTVRFSLRRDGSIIGEPRITFSDTPRESSVRELFAQAAADAVTRCAPLRVTPGLGAAVAGRPLAIRLIYNGPKGRGA